MGPVHVYGDSALIVETVPATLDGVPYTIPPSGYVKVEDRNGGTLRVTTPDGLEIPLVLNPSGFLRDCSLFASLELTEGDMPCIADIGRNGVADVGLGGYRDLERWHGAFLIGSPLADQNRDGCVSPSELNAWIRNFSLGCP